ncbi:MAG: anthranilate phosphoribosyltransferase [Chromatiales bacterium]|nr:anthranilate phosphoribosyltransferase [Chromatiales bacterium]
MNDSAETGFPLDALIGRIATGPKLSKPLDRDQAAAGMRAILEGSAHPVQAAIFLIALRMKRETDDENLGLLDALLAASHRARADVPLVVDVSEPYDGFARQLLVTPFLPAVLAACGVPAVSHGVWSTAPKHGLTHARVLAAAGVTVDRPPAEVAARLTDPRIGWGYVDQSRYCPALHGLGELRRLMVKRTALSTLERVLAPIRARGRTHLLAGYVHTAYPRVYAILAAAAGHDSALLVRGGEGGVVPALNQDGVAWRWDGRDAPERLTLSPLAAGVDQDLRAAPAPAACSDAADAGAAATAAIGLATLEGAPGPARDALVYGAASCLVDVGCAPDLRAAADQVRRCIDDGAARARFEAGRG